MPQDHMRRMLADKARVAPLRESYGIGSLTGFLVAGTHAAWHIMVSLP